MPCRNQNKRKSLTLSPRKAALSRQATPWLSKILRAFKQSKQHRIRRKQKHPHYHLNLLNRRWRGIVRFWKRRRLALTPCHLLRAFKQSKQHRIRRKQKHPHYHLNLLNRRWRGIVRFWKRRRLALIQLFRWQRRAWFVKRMRLRNLPGMIAMKRKRDLLLMVETNIVNAKNTYPSKKHLLRPRAIRAVFLLVLKEVFLRKKSRIDPKKKQSTNKSRKNPGLFQKKRLYLLLSKRRRKSLRRVILMESCPKRWSLKKSGKR